MITVTNSQTNTNKKDIAKNIFLNVGIPFSFSEKIINDLIETLIQNLKESKILKINKFGSFKVQKKDKRVGRNPKNMKKYDISERLVVTFKSSKYLKARINKNVK